MRGFAQRGTLMRSLISMQSCAIPSGPTICCRPSTAAITCTLRRPDIAPWARQSPSACFSEECLAARRLWPLGQGNVSRRIFGADVVGAGTNQTVVVELLDHVGCPARNAADGEDRRVEVDVDAQRVVRRRRVEIDIRIQLLFVLDIDLYRPGHVEP